MSDKKRDDRLYDNYTPDDGGVMNYSAAIEAARKAVSGHGGQAAVEPDTREMPLVGGAAVAPPDKTDKPAEPQEAFAPPVPQADAIDPIAAAVAAAAEAFVSSPLDGDVGGDITQRDVKVIDIADAPEWEPPEPKQPAQIPSGQHMARPAEQQPNDGQSRRQRVRADIVTRLFRLRMQHGSMFALALASAYIGLSQAVALPMPQAISRAGNPELFLMVTLLLGALALACSFDLAASAFRQLASLRPNMELMLTLSLLCTLLHSLYMLASATPQAPPVYHSYVFLSVCGIYIYYLMRTRQLKKARVDYRNVVVKGEKQLISRLSDPAVLREMDLADGDGIGVMQRSGLDLMDCFNEKRYENYITERAGVYFTPIVLAAAAAVAIVAGVTGGGMAGVLTAIAAMLAMSVPMNFFIMAAGPLQTACRRLKVLSVSLIGYDAAGAFSEIERLTVSDTDLFEGHVQLCGIKIFGSGRIDEVIVDAASIFRAVGGPMCGVLLQVVDNNEALLLDVTHIRSADGQGMQAFIEGRSILLGTREFMLQNHVPLIDEAVADKLLNLGKRGLYMARNGELVALIAVAYEGDEASSHYLNKLLGSGLELWVRSFDPNVTRELVADKFALDAGSVRIMPGYYADLIDRSMAKRVDTTAVMVSPKLGLASFARALGGCFKIKSAIYINMIVSLLSVVMGAVLMGFMIITGNIEGAGAHNVMLFQMLWLLPTLVVTLVTKILI